MAEKETLAAVVAQVDDLRGTVAKLHATVTQRSARWRPGGAANLAGYQTLASSQKAVPVPAP
jgi:hypothetical protein